MPLRSLDQALNQRLAVADESAAVDAIDFVLAQATHHQASDVHFEPWEDCLAVRLRIDGILHEVARLPKPAHAQMIARIKILARVVTYQRDVPQDGRIEPDATSCGKGMRVSTFPTVYGEKAVIRILDARTDRYTLDALGFQPEVAAALRRIIVQPQGTLLLTGPSSSGKTTTIYALLRDLLTAARRGGPAPHIVTIEDPVEYRLGHVAQTEVNPHIGLTFENALRSLLRQDPEVVMLGEIRDAETAHTAIQAGLTGHLVISTIHSGTAAGVFTRLLDMGIEPFLIASSVTGVLAQRLVRVVCPACAQPATPETALLDAYGLAREDGPFRQGRGCDACQGIGYSGRTALGELLMMNEAIADLILSRARTSVLHEAAVNGGMAPLADDGVLRARQGVTTLDELRRVLPPAVR
jgi:type II secretory ATPase GspE/PulE/Tfp pilus assembly ATPase PilB-like protein